MKRQIDEAKQFLMKAGKASNPIKGVTSRCKMLPADRELMSEAMLADEASEVFTRDAPPRHFQRTPKVGIHSVHGCIASGHDFRRQKVDGYAVQVP